jgi:hypothetical protein
MATTTPKEAKIFFTTGTDENDPFVGLKKLWGGFCDPHRTYDDSASVASTPPYHHEATSSTSEKESSSSGQTHGMGGTSVEEAVEQDSDGMEVVLENERHEEHTPPPVEEVVVDPPSPIILKATHAGPTARRKRGVEIAVVAIFFVVATLFTLQQFGYELDLKVVEIQLKKASAEASSSHLFRNLINISLRDKPVVGVEPAASESESSTMPQNQTQPVTESETEKLQEEVVDDVATENTAKESATTPVIKEEHASPTNEMPQTAEEEVIYIDESDEVEPVESDDVVPGESDRKEQDIIDAQDVIEAEIMEEMAAAKPDASAEL